MKVTLLLAILMPAVACQSQVRTFPWQNTQRQYMLFEPSDRDGAVPVMYFLHGLGDNITRCNEEMHFGDMAERFGWVIVVPQATNVYGSAMWNAGLGGTADDAGFLLALLDTLVAHGRVNADSVFFTGFSMGGFMTHRMAIEHGNRITACAPVSGLISHAFAGEVPVGPVRMLHIHGTSDPVVSWNGGSSYFGDIGISVDSLVSFWTHWNNCGNEPAVDTLPDRVSDGLRFIRYRYSGASEFQLLKVVGGNHTWYIDSNAHDIDYFDFIHRFFVGETSAAGTEKPSTTVAGFEVWPNPTSSHLYVRLYEPRTLTVYDSMGRIVIRKECGAGTTLFDTGSLEKGLYIVSDKSGSSRKIVVE